MVDFGSVDSFDRFLPVGFPIEIPHQYETLLEFFETTFECALDDFRFGNVAWLCEF